MDHLQIAVYVTIICLPTACLQSHSKLFSSFYGGNMDLLINNIHVQYYHKDALSYNWSIVFPYVLTIWL